MSKDGIGQVLLSNPWTSLALTAFALAAYVNPEGTKQGLATTFNVLHDIVMNTPQIASNFMQMLPR